MAGASVAGELARGTGRMKRCGINWFEVLMALWCRVISMQVQTVVPGGVRGLWC